MKAKEKYRDEDGCVNIKYAVTLTTVWWRFVSYKNGQILFCGWVTAASCRITAGWNVTEQHIDVILDDIGGRIRLWVHEGLIMSSLGSLNKYRISADLPRTTTFKLNLWMRSEMVVGWFSLVGTCCGKTPTVLQVTILTVYKPSVTKWY